MFNAVRLKKITAKLINDYGFQTQDSMIWNP